jgi:hypothetical protein
LNQSPLFPDYLWQIRFEHVDMVGLTSRKDTSTSFGGAVALALCLAGAAPSQAAAQSVGSAYTDYDTKTCPHKAGRAVEDYGANGGARGSTAWRCG